MAESLARMPAPNGPLSCRAKMNWVACAGVATVIKVKDIVRIADRIW